MKNLICLLEEPSAKEMLKTVIPRIVPDVSVQYIVFEGKQDLEKHLEKKLKHYRMPNSRFLVMRDQDSGECEPIKHGLSDKVQASGKHDVTTIRIACRELESFYLGDLEAVEKGLQMNGLAKLQSKAKYRTPDNLANAAEELSKLTRNQYQKIAGSRNISPHLKVDGSSTSHSFNILLDGIKKLMEHR